MRRWPMTHFKVDWEQLNDKQQLAVKSIKGNYLVLAPAGTGKTKVIAMRTSYMLQQGVAPEHILNLTFTNKAAKEMEARIQFYDAKNSQQLIIKTFHSFCYYLINQEKNNTHLTFPCTIIDESDTLDILKRIVFALTKQELSNGSSLISFVENVKKHSLQFPQDQRSHYTVFVNDYLKQNKIKDPLLTTYGARILKLYQKYLKTNNCVDFIDLIIEATYLLEDPKVAKKWQQRFKYIQIDEMQDTSTREYALLTKLSKGNHVALFGDFNQTIYEWRGSNPELMTRQYEKEYKPIKIELEYNYRSTQTLLKAANQYLRNTSLYPLVCEAKGAEIGEPIEVLIAKNEQQEIRGVAASIIEHLKQNEKRIAVLTRINGTAKKVYDVFERMGIPALKVEDTRLFRKKPVKDVAALFNYAMNRRNSHALEKLLKHQLLGCEEWLLYELKKTQKDYMYLHDWFLTEHSDPYWQLDKAYKENAVIVLDVESTGLDTTTEDIIQIAAIKYGQEGEKETLDLLVKPTKSVGASYHIHGFSDEQLQKEGIPPKEALQKLNAFVKNNVVVGHNIQYDLNIIRSMMYRYDEKQFIPKAIYDTLDLACKVYPHLPNHKLETLAAFIQTKHTPNHNAYHDIMATGEVLSHLLACINKKKNERLQALEAYYPYIHDYKIKLLSLVDVALASKTFEVIEHLMTTCGLKDAYDEQDCCALRDYYKIAKALYDEDLSVQDNILKLLAFSALHHSEVEQSDLFKNRVPIITIHQAKGLEFDYVYMVGCNEGLFPLQRSVREGLVNEEKRLFYVGMTRAKKKLYLSYNTMKKMSFLIEEIGQDFKKYRQLDK